MKDHFMNTKRMPGDRDAEIARLRDALDAAENARDIARDERDRDYAEMRRFQGEWRKMLDEKQAAEAREAGYVAALADLVGGAIGSSPTGHEWWCSRAGGDPATCESCGAWIRARQALAGAPRAEARATDAAEGSGNG